MPIYLDHNAGAPLRPQVRDAIAGLMGGRSGNPASVHRSGQVARRLLEQARAEVASLIGADPAQIVFTSGGTEANNMAIMGVARAADSRRRIITSAIEHSSVLMPVRRLESEGFEVVRIAPDRDGRVDPSRVAALLDDATALVTLGLANSEVGTIQNLSPLAAQIRSVGAIFHVDAAQAAGRMRLCAPDLGCDLMTISGHKLGAPGGIGALFVRDPQGMAPLILGGPQEHGLRAGTPNLVGAVGFGAAASAVFSQLDLEVRCIAALRDDLLDRLVSAIPGLIINNPIRDALPNTLNLAFPGVLGETMLIALDLEGVEVSMGSACAAGAVEPSHVLLAMGRSEQQARSSLRISLGYSTTADEAQRACEIITRVWRRVARADVREAPLQL